MFSEIRKLEYSQVIIIILVIIGLIGLNVVSAIYVRNISYQNTKETMELKLQQAAEKLQNKVFFRVREAVDGLSENSEVVAAFAQEMTQDYPARDYIEKAMEDIKEVLNANAIYLMDKQGTVIAGTTYEATNQSFTGNNYSFRPYFQQAVSGQPDIYGAVGITSHQKGFYFSSPVTAEGEVIGVVVIKIGMKEINNILSDIDSTTLLVAPERVVFAANNNKYMYNLLTRPPSPAPKLSKEERAQQFGGRKIVERRFIAYGKEVLNKGDKYLLSSFDLELEGWKLTMLREVEGIFYAERYANIFWILEFIILFLGLIIVALLINRFYKLKLEDKLRKFSKIVEQNPVSIAITDLEGNVEYVNRSFEEVTGYSREEIKGKNIDILQADKFAEDYYQELWETIRAGETWEGEFYNQTKNGDYYWERARITPLTNQAGEIEAFVDMKENISEEKELKQKLEFLAERDELTGAYNRRAGYEILQENKRLADQQNRKFSLAFVDINNLKVVNDNFGHDQGDELIVKVVDTIKAGIRDSDYIIRFGGDEFVIVFVEVAPEDVKQIMERIQRQLQRKKDKVDYEISISYGVETYSGRQKREINEIIAQADENMYQFKKEYKAEHDLEER